MKYPLTAISILLSTYLLTGQEIKQDYKPKFDFTLKTKYEYSPDTKAGRFTVRNSRLGLYGSISTKVSYKVQIELSSEGKLEVLDLMANVKLFKGFDVSLGQTSLPVFNSYQTTPAQMLFANRSFLTKFNAGSRDIGVLANYKCEIGETPVAFQFGVFNGSTINKPIWTDKPSYTARVLVGTMDGLRATIKVYKYPLGQREDFFISGADLRYAAERLKIESEVMNRHNYFNGVNRFTSYIQGAYSFPINIGELFKDITPAVRWDGISENLKDNGFDINRLTIGFSFGFTSKPFNSLLRFDYEKYFIKNPIAEFSSLYDEIDADKFTIELLIVL